VVANHFYYLCANCAQVAVISRVVLVRCPNCNEPLQRQKDLESMLTGYDDSVEFTVWEKTVEDEPPAFLSEGWEQ
jgi:hypothetical protein